MVMGIAMQETGQEASAINNTDLFTDLYGDKLKIAAANEFDNLWIDKLNAALQCPVIPTKLHFGLLNWRDALVKTVFDNRIKIEMETVSNTVNAECNGRKHMYLNLTNEFTNLAMLLVEKDYLLGRRLLRKEESPEDYNRVLTKGDKNVPSSTLLRASLFILQVRAIEVFQNLMFTCSKLFLLY